MSFTVYIQPGDTIITLASIHLGDAQKWRDIASFNKLDAPYIVNDATTYRAAGLKVLQTDDAIIIPSSTAPLISANTAQLEARVYGTDHAWNETTHALITDGIGNVALDIGLENLRKKCLRALIQKPGDIPNHPNTGNKAVFYVGLAANPANLELINFETRAALLAIPEVESVTVNSEYASNGAVYVTCIINPIPPAETFTLNTTIGN